MQGVVADIQEARRQINVAGDCAGEVNIEPLQRLAVIQREGRKAAVHANDDFAGREGGPYIRRRGMTNEGDERCRDDRSQCQHRETQGDRAL